MEELGSGAEALEMSDCCKELSCVVYSLCGKESLCDEDARVSELPAESVLNPFDDDKDSHGELEAKPLMLLEAVGRYEEPVLPGEFKPEFSSAEV